MPELPEVEGLRRRLVPHVVGRRIGRLDVRDVKLWHTSEGLSAADAAGHELLAIERYAKLLRFRLEYGLSLLLHLKIAGQVAFDPLEGARFLGGHPYPLPNAALPDTSTRFVLHLDSGDTLYVNDQRRFAWLRLLADADADAFVAAQKYGPDPLDARFSPAVLAARLAARQNRPIKAALLDQTCIAGLGNIYVDESLHAARLHPMLRAAELKPADVKRLHRAILDVLALAVPVGGALVKVGRAVDDSDSGRDFLRAHGRAGELCPNCGAAVRRGRAPKEPPRIVRAFLAGRGTYFCPTCQVAPPGFVMPVEAVATSNDGDDQP